MSRHPPTRRSPLEWRRWGRRLAAAWLAIPAASSCIFELPEGRVIEQQPPIECEAACCAPEETQPCYGGPDELAGIGACSLGAQPCDLESGAFGACEGWVAPTIELCASDEDENCDGRGCSGDVLWIESYPTGDFGWGQALDIASGQDVLIVGGEFEGALNLGESALPTSGGRDLFVAAFETSGDLRWAIGFGSDGEDRMDRGPAVTALDDGGAVATGTLGLGAGALAGADLSGLDDDAVLVRLDALGEVSWAKRLVATGVQAGVSISARPDGSVILVGRAEQTMDFGEGEVAVTGESDLFAAAYDAGGELLWSHLVGSAESDQAHSVATTSEGEAFVVGTFRDGFTWDGITLQTDDPVATDMFVAKLAASGEIVWLERFGGVSTAELTPDVHPTSVAVDPTSGHVVVAGRFSGRFTVGAETLTTAGGGSDDDLFALRLDASGKVEWVRAYGDASPEQALWAATIDDAGQIVLAGMLIGQVDLGDGFSFEGYEEPGYATDGLLMKLATDGTIQWVRPLSGPGIQVVHGVGTLPTGEIAFTGYLTGDILEPPVSYFGGASQPPNLLMSLLSP